MRHPHQRAVRLCRLHEPSTALPDGLDTRRAMAIGTAGYTAMLCVMAIERAGVRPDSGTVLVTGAAGGVGSVAIALLAKSSALAEVPLAGDVIDLDANAIRILKQGAIITRVTVH